MGNNSNLWKPGLFPPGAGEREGGYRHLGNITHQVNTSNIVVDEYSFDAWGRRRNPADWSYDLTGQPALVADRGFTGHEYLPWYNLYNMNGRLYDPLVGRFLNPDPYIQDAGFTQSYNRYSYCLNNPLKYTDPSGYKWGWWALAEVLTGGAVSLTTVATYSAALATSVTMQTTASTVDNMVSSTKMSFNMAKDIFNPGDRIYEDDSWIFKDMVNCFKIDLGYANSLLGTFKYDESASGIEWPLQVYNNLTGGEMLQSNLGNSFSHLQNMFGHIQGVGYYEGRTIVRLDDDYIGNESFLAISLGHYILGENIAYGPKDNTGNINLFAHEFGHTYQSRISGPMYLFSHGIPSARGDQNTWTEADADYRAYKKFGFWPHPKFGVRQPTHYTFEDFLMGVLVLFK